MSEEKPAAEEPAAEPAAPPAASPRGRADYHLDLIQSLPTLTHRHSVSGEALHVDANLEAMLEIGADEFLEPLAALKPSGRK